MQVLVQLACLVFAVCVWTARAQNGTSVTENRKCQKFDCTGLDCLRIPERNGCVICACPIGSPARGCDQMPRRMWHELMFAGCPDETDTDLPRKPSQKVYRYYRKIDEATGVDECRSYVFPYCQALDFNLWRSPRTLDECLFYCYSAEELRNRDLLR